MVVDFNRNVYCILGLPFDAITTAEAVKCLQAAKDTRKHCFLSTPNLNFLIGCRNDVDFRASVLNSDLSICDGMPILWLARLLRIPIPERVSGAGVFEALRTDTTKRMSVFFFGGPDGVAKVAQAKLNGEVSGLTCVGFLSPGFGSIDDISTDSILGDINSTQADFLVVALGAKKGQLWIQRNRSKMTAPIISHLGAVVNFVAGTVSRAPRWMQRCGLEWFWRIWEEPVLWRRYWVDGCTLFSLFLTRVLPYAWHLRCYPIRASELTQTAVSLVELQDEIVIYLAGVWVEGNLLPVRETLQNAVKYKADITLEMSGVTNVDSAFIALVMLLYGHQKMTGLRLEINGLRPNVSKVFDYLCADFVFADMVPM